MYISLNAISDLKKSNNIKVKGQIMRPFTLQVKTMAI